MAVPQILIIQLLAFWGKPWAALGVMGLLLVQFVLMRRLLRDPRGQAIWYNATGTTLYVLGMLITAFAIRSGVAG
jgi:chlorophyll synthase